MLTLKHYRKCCIVPKPNPDFLFIWPKLRLTGYHCAITTLLPAAPQRGVKVRLFAEARVLAGAAEAAAAATGLGLVVLGAASVAELLEVGGGEHADPPDFVEFLQ